MSGQDRWRDAEDAVVDAWLLPNTTSGSLGYVDPSGTPSPSRTKVPRLRHVDGARRDGRRGPVLILMMTCMSREDRGLPRRQGGLRVVCLGDEESVAMSCGRRGRRRARSGSSVTVTRSTCLRYLRGDGYENVGELCLGRQGRARCFTGVHAAGRWTVVPSVSRRGI